MWGTRRGPPPFPVSLAVIDRGSVQTDPLRFQARSAAINRGRAETDRGSVETGRDWVETDPPRFQARLAAIGPDSAVAIGPAGPVIDLAATAAVFSGRGLVPTTDPAGPTTDPAGPTTDPVRATATIGASAMGVATATGELVAETTSTPATPS